MYNFFKILLTHLFWQHLCIITQIYEIPIAAYKKLLKPFALQIVQYVEQIPFNQVAQVHINSLIYQNQIHMYLRASK